MLFVIRWGFIEFQTLQQQIFDDFSIHEESIEPQRRKEGGFGTCVNRK